MQLLRCIGGHCLVPIRQALSFDNELRAGEWLGEDVGPHGLCRASDYVDAAVLHLFLDPEVADVDVSAALGAWSAVVNEGHRRVVVLVDDGGSRVLPLGDDEAAKADHLRGDVRHGD